MKWIGGLLTVGFLSLASPTSGATCESLSTFSQPHVTVTLAQTVGAGRFTRTGQ